MRKLTLYIGGRKAELDGDGLVLMNYSFAEVGEPAVVKNSYSQSLTLKGSPANDAIFGGMWRTDRAVGAGGTGTGFNPMARTPFRILGGDGELVQSGYMKLDTIEAGPAGHDYRITLYGGLGAFLYTLGYDSAGEARTLADLQWTVAGGSDELDFDITAGAVAEAWERLEAVTAGSETAGDDKWDVINFAPAWEGFPDNFDSSKAVFRPSAYGLADSVTRDGTAYSSKSGEALLDLGEDEDGWECGDLRSYLQRPAVSVEAFLRAVARFAEANGYTFDWPGVKFPDSLWMTLPALPDIKEYAKVSGSVTLNFPVDAMTGRAGSFPDTFFPSYPAGTMVHVDVRLDLHVLFGTDPGADALSLGGVNLTEDTNDSTVVTAYERNQWGFLVQLAGLDANGNAVAFSKVMHYGDGVMTARAAVWGTGFTSYAGGVPTSDDLGDTIGTGLVRADGNDYVLDKAVALSLEGYDVKAVTILVHPYRRKETYEANTGSEGGSSEDVTWTTDVGGATGTYGEAVFHDGTGWRLTQDAGLASTMTYEGAETVRSGAHVTKAMLLSTFGVKDVLLGLAKAFGLCFVMDDTGKAVTLMTRNAFYRSGRTLDLSDRVDMGSARTLTPLAFDYRFADFLHDPAEGEFAKVYSDRYGSPYGRQRVNTGYEFSDGSEDIIGDGPFRGAVCGSRFSRHFCSVKDGSGKAVPAQFLDSVSYTLWSATGGEEAVEIAVPSSFTRTWWAYRDDLPSGADGWFPLSAPLCEFRDGEGKGVDGDGVLVAFGGFVSGLGATLSDDDAAMDAMNGGRPCWRIGEGTAPKYGFPLFTRLVPGQTRAWFVARSMDFGRARELPGPSFLRYRAEAGEGVTLYERYWKRFIEDRLRSDGLVLSCKVRLAGMQVGQGLFRNLYWFGGSLWALNKISNHSLTKDALTECEFVRVHDRGAYVSGQDWDETGDYSADYSTDYFAED